jgi:NADPH-dependent 2,4-dienoyl-CoA reductase/sulfur reductase-like enzyme
VPRLRAELEKARVVGVVGAGYIGVEMAEALLHLGKRVLVFEMFDQVLPGALDPDVAKIVEDEMRKAGVELHLSEKVVEFRKKVDEIIENPIYRESYGL